MSNNIRSLVLEFFRQHPKQNFSFEFIVDWFKKNYPNGSGIPQKDIQRSLYQLHQEKLLIELKNGVYKFNSKKIENVNLHEFPAHVEEAIFERDDFKCIFCGIGRKEGVEIFADHIVSKANGGNDTIDNGQTLCFEHKLLKENHSQVEAGEIFFINMYEKALSINDQKMIGFCNCIFKCFDDHNILSNC